MLSLTLLSSSYNAHPPISGPTQPAPKLLESLPAESHTLPTPTEAQVIFTTRRPALLTYTSRMISLTRRLLSLPLYALSLAHESETLVVGMAESVEFSPRVPAYALLELQAQTRAPSESEVKMEVYDARIMFTARFSGLRWLMYNHRVVSFLVGVGCFWGTATVVMGLVWVGIRVRMGGEREGTGVLNGEGDESAVEVKIKEGGVKEEETDDPDLSDTPRTFPSYGRQQPLRYEPRVKSEGEEEGLVIDETAIQPLGEADDEDEDGDGGYGGFGGKTDSGIGTSFSEGGEKIGLARRRSKGRGGG